MNECQLVIHYKCLIHNKSQFSEVCINSLSFDKSAIELIIFWPRDWLVEVPRGQVNLALPHEVVAAHHVLVVHVQHDGHERVLDVHVEGLVPDRVHRLLFLRRLVQGLLLLDELHIGIARAWKEERIKAKRKRRQTLIKVRCIGIINVLPNPLAIRKREKTKTKLGSFDNNP